MRRYLTFFPQAQNVHLLKDVGMIPYLLHKQFNYDAVLACYNNGNYEYLDKEVKGLKIVFIKKIFNSQFLDGLLFILTNAHKFDIFQGYNFTRRTLLWAYFFKVLKLGKGKTYIKLDTDDTILRYESPKSVSRKLAFILSGIDLISVEAKKYLDHLNHRNIFGKKIEYIPNGLFDDGLRKDTPFEMKDNKIITVGRIGTAQKATEILCKGFEIFAKNNTLWKLEIIGPIENSFKPYINSYFERNPHLKSQVIFTGAINDRLTLESHYRSAKIFALTSTYEGFPHVFQDAMRFGCYIISSDFSSASDVIDDGKYGDLFPVNDYEALAQKLTYICNEQDQLKDISVNIQSFGYKKYYWPDICTRIHHLLTVN